MITSSSTRAKALTLLAVIVLVACSLFVGRDGSKSISSATVISRTAEPAPHEPLLVEPLLDPEFTPSSNHSSLVRRAEDDYSCRAGRPCHNGACCGASGYCGYGPTYCGTGCISNCKASAECGQYSNPAGKKCPLNTCCSKHGFCGTTKDFCTDGCQSNCVLSPSPPASPKGQALSKVIGYYESWSYRSTCNHKKPTDLPLNELTHLNYAFAFISPSSYELVVMDSKTEEGLFKVTTDVKEYNSDLKVFISVGGWTFSDNGTVTQPLLSEISSTDSNRQKFADNVVKFCNKWGFDGLDLDWEYPGAPDRGGKPEDTENFTKLMKTLRQTFNGSPRQLGLSFTIPSSYWYLKWFDMPGLMKYADWTNMMSYDLHGVWDRNNPIGSIVQGHTNLTEIKLAAELLWRVGVKPEQVALGYGFYGRAFELQDSGCSRPGCAFKGGAKKGPCSQESGILMHYEIQAMLNQAQHLEPIWDKEAAVKYLVFDNNQWVSYDDKDTFGQKIDWANSVGFGGALIWAADTDDDKFTAMSGFLGKKVAHIDTAPVALQANAVNIAQSHNALSGKQCSLYKEGGCQSQHNLDTAHVMCPNGTPPIGYDKDGCKEGGKPICCEGNIRPAKCQWRGSGGDCNGQCHPGEQKVHGSSWGGGYESESGVNKCSRGGKAFCCEAGDYKNLVSGCKWSNCGGFCTLGTKSMLKSGQCGGFQTKHYCCPTTTLLHDCSWRGKIPDCPVANCEKDEVNVVLDETGDQVLSCHWGRHVAGCCKVNNPPLPKLQCPKTTCELNPLLCTGTTDDYGNPEGSVSKRDLANLEKRKPPGYKWTTVGGYAMVAAVRTYPRGVDYMSLLSSRLQGLYTRYFGMQELDCDRRVLRSLVIETEARPVNTEVEHAAPLSLASRYPATANHGLNWERRPMGRANPRPNGTATTTPAISDEFFTLHWNNDEALSADTERLTPGSPIIRNPSQLFAEGLGSNTNPSNFMLLDEAVNGAKGEIEAFKRHISNDRLRVNIRGIAANNEAAATLIIESLQETQAVFTYLNNEDTMTRVDNVVGDVRRALQIIERQIPSGAGLVAHWDEFYPTYMADVSAYQREIVTTQIRMVRDALGQSTEDLAVQTLATLTMIENNIENMYYPFEDKP